MKKTQNALNKIFFGFSYCFVSIHSIAVMFRLLKYSDGLCELFNSTAISIIWTMLLGIGGIYIYSIIVEPFK